jgi:hypothetical protein
MPEQDKPKESPRIIPTVPQRDRERLNEGVEKQRQPQPPKLPAKEKYTASY